MSIVHNQSINYEQKVSSAPQYVYTKVPQQQGGNNVAWSASSSTTATFDIPAQVLNLSKSFLRFQILTTGSGAGTSAQKAHLSFPPIRRLSLMTRSGMYLCDIQNFRHFWKLTKNLIVPTQEFLSYPQPGIGSTTTIASQRGLTLFNNPSSSLASTAPLAGALNGAKIIPNAVPIVDVSSTFRRAYQTEISYASAALGDAGATANLAINCELRLGKIPFSIFNVNRDLFSTEALQLVVEFCSWDEYLFATTVVGTLVGPITAPTAGASPTLTNLALYCCLEKNPDVAQSIMSKVMTGGLRMTVPYSTVQRNALGTNLSANTTMRINRGHGSRLLRVISGESLTADTLSSACAYSNLDAVNNTNLLTTTFYTTLNSERQEAEVLTTTTGDDYKYNARLLKGCPLEVVQEYYTEAPVHINDFSGCSSLIEAPEKDLEMAGLSLVDKEYTWIKNIDSKTNLDSTSTVIAVCQKTLISTAEGIVVQ